jgi:hypothetical protein
MLQKLQPTLEEVQQLFEEWRRTKRRRDRIPTALWEAAASLSGQHSANKISKLLRLNHTAVRDCIGAHKQGEEIQGNAPAFIELAMSPSATVGDITIEMQRPDGGRMKICGKGSCCDAVALSKAFWGRGT